MKTSCEYMLFLTLLVSVIVSSCNSGEKKGPEPESEADGPAWKLDGPLPSRVEVLRGKTLLETFEFAYDENDHLISLVKKNIPDEKLLLDLKYSYSGENDMTVSGTFYPAAKTMVATIDANTLSYGFSGGLRYEISFDRDGSLSTLQTSDSFVSEGGQYSRKVKYLEKYLFDGGNCSVVSVSNDCEALSSKINGTVFASSLEYVFTYLDEPDKQNFAAFLMGCEFPVWYAAGLPANAKLVCGMKMKCGGVDGVISWTIDYDLDDEGNIISAIKTDYIDGEEILSKTFDFYYR